MVEARGVDGLLDVEAAFRGGEEDAGDGGDDAGAAGRAEDVAELAVFEDDGGGHGAQGALAGGDGVGRTLNEAEHVGNTELDGEVVHLVVEQKAERTGGDAGAETVIEGGGDGDGVAFRIDDGVVGGVVGFGAAAAGGFGRGREETGGAREGGAGSGGGGVDGGAPGGGVGFGGEFGAGDGVVVGVAEVVGAVHVGAAIGFDDEVDGLGGAVARFGQVVAFEDIEGAEQDDAA